MGEVADRIRELERGLKKGHPELEGKPLGDAELTPAHVQALEVNLRGQIQNTFRNGSTASINNQLRNPRFRFLGRVTPALRTEFIQALRARPDHAEIAAALREWMGRIPSQVAGHREHVAAWQAELRELIQAIDGP